MMIHGQSVIFSLCDPLQSWHLYTASGLQHRRGVIAKMESFSFCITVALAEKISLPATLLTLKPCVTIIHDAVLDRRLVILGQAHRFYPEISGLVNVVVGKVPPWYPFMVAKNTVRIKSRLQNNVPNQSLSKIPLFTILGKISKKPYVFKNIVYLWNTNDNACEQSLHWIYSHLYPKVRCQLTWIPYL